MLASLIDNHYRGEGLVRRHPDAVLLPQMSRGRGRIGIDCADES